MTLSYQVTNYKEAKMFAWMSTIDWDPQRLDEAVRHFKEHRLPEISKSAGFKKAYLMMDRKKGKMVVLNVFENEKDAQAFAETRKKGMASGHGPNEAGGKNPATEIMEVVVEG